MCAGAEGDVDAFGGELEFAGAFDEVPEDRVRGRGLVAVTLAVLACLVAASTGLGYTTSPWRSVFSVTTRGSTKCSR